MGLSNVSFRHYVLLLLIFWSAVFPIRAFSNQCRDIFKQPTADSWNELKLTPPRAFQTTGRYQILVHGISSSTVLFEHPDLVSTAKFLSVSLISSEKPLTFANSGLVIEAQDSNVITASRHDMFVGRKNDESVARAQAKYGRKGPQQILNETKTPLWNEIIVTGQNRPGLRAVGYFVVISAEGQPLIKQNRLSQIEAASAKTGLPILYIRNPERRHVHDGIEWD